MLKKIDGFAIIKQKNTSKKINVRVIMVFFYLMKKLIIQSY